MQVKIVAPWPLRFAWLGAVLMSLGLRPALAQDTPQRDVFFGETHVHTSWSFDAYIFGNTKTGLADAYRYAMGEEIDHPMGYKVRITQEIKQIKGQSETTPILSPGDDFANFEALNYLLGDPAGRVIHQHGSYIREALRNGIGMEQARGYNPYKFGIVGGSDSHNTAVPYRQQNFFGGHAFNDGDIKQRMSGHVFAGLDVRLENPAGLTAVWAEDNTRASLFEAMQRKETYGTSGVRIKLRMFGGWGWGLEELKLLGRWESNSEWAKMGYRSGVPMGSDLPAPKGKAPSFAVYAVKDPESGNLDRIQIIKGWAKNGQTFEKIYDVVWAGDRKPDPVTGAVPPIGSTVDLTKASYTNTIGAVELKTVWTDPDFDPSLDAFYYARVLEIPTPRWTTIQAAELGQVPPSVVAATVQERAWSSPIWFTPTAEGRKSAAPGTTVADLKTKGAIPLSDTQLKDLIVGKTVAARNTVTGQRFEIFYGSTGRRMIVSIDGKQPEPGDLFHPNHQMEAGSPAPYEIKDGQLVTTLDNMPFAVTVYKVDNKYIAARSNEFGYANYEIVEVKL